MSIVRDLEGSVPKRMCSCPTKVAQNYLGHSLLANYSDQMPGKAQRIRNSEPNKRKALMVVWPSGEMGTRSCLSDLSLPYNLREGLLLSSSILVTIKARDTSYCSTL